MDAHAILHAESLRLPHPATRAINISLSLGRKFRRQLHVNRGQFRRLSPTPQRILRTKLLEFFFARSTRNLQRRIDRPGRDPCTRIPFDPNCLASDFT
jgi:hypothetical protein